MGFVQYRGLILEQFFQFVFLGALFAVILDLCLIINMVGINPVALIPFACVVSESLYNTQRTVCIRSQKAVSQHKLPAYLIIRARANDQEDTSEEEYFLHRGYILLNCTRIQTAAKSIISRMAKAVIRKVKCGLRFVCLNG